MSLCPRLNAQRFELQDFESPGWPTCWGHPRFQQWSVEKYGGHLKLHISSHCDSLQTLMPHLSCTRLLQDTSPPGGEWQWRPRNRVRPIPCWRPIPDTIGRSCTDTDTGNDITYSLRQTYVTYIAHSVRMFQNITSLTSWTAVYLLLSAAPGECISYNETNYRLETTGMHATVLTVKTGKTTGIGTDTKISIGRYRFPPILAGIGLTLLRNTAGSSVSYSSQVILLIIH